MDSLNGSVSRINLLVSANSSVLQLKQYEIFVRVLCLTSPSDTVEFLCSSGRNNIVVPTRWTGLRQVSLTLDTAIDPGVTPIHEFGFIVTATELVPQSDPMIFAGANATQVSLPQGGSVTLDLVITGFLGVRAGTGVTLALDALPQGVTANIEQPSLLLEVTAEMENPHAMTRLTLTSAPDAPAGFSQTKLVAAATDPAPGLDADQSLIEIVVAPAQ